MKSIYLILISATLLIFSGCDAPRPLRVYTEIVPPQEELIPTPAAFEMPSLGMDTPAPSINLQWDTPSGWTEEPGNGIRLATLKPEDGSIICTIVYLAGNPGTLEQNVVRWLRQAGLELTQEELVSYLENIQLDINAYNVPLNIIDFTDLTAEDGHPSMLAAIIEEEEGQVFIKMTGMREAVQKQGASFEELINSLRINHEKE